jgi:hypothetical protein
MDRIAMHRQHPGLAWVLAACALTLPALVGCSREEKPKPKTVASVQAQIDNVKNDTKMPPRIKAMVLGQLQAERQRVQQQGAQGGGR